MRESGGPQGKNVFSLGLSGLLHLQSLIKQTGGQAYTTRVKLALNVLIHSTPAAIIHNSGIQ